ncbi:MAG: aminotransferase class I/II-fold pyridoxal phosphate-dependent enzyme [Acidobacteriota bacterium]|nr:aminotransferase class I/II-fold pyridoxal phosphate-dependent enzyme [Acidobacteriota bacterium]
MMASGNSESEVPLHGVQLRQISEQFSVELSELIDFSANVTPDGVPPGVLSTLRSCLEELSVFTSYPDLESASLKQSMATYCRLTPQNIAVANGFVPLFECALRTFKIKRCMLPVPAFVEYRRSLARCGVEISSHPLTPGSAFRYESHALVNGDHDAIVLANPQNPSGTLNHKEVLLDLVKSCADRNIKVLLDEAFIDYAPTDSLTHEVEQLNNLVVFRSVTKFQGMPGLRVAYAAANHSLAKSLNQNLPPWPVTTLAALAAVAALKDETFAVRTRERNEARRNQLRLGLERAGLLVYPSAGNYLLFRIAPCTSPQRFWERMILEHHFVLRNCSNYEGLSGGHFRSAVRTEPENEALLRAISKVLIDR